MRARELGEVARLFLRLSLTGFGGPAVHVGLMREEVVRRRRWVDDRRFLDLVGATNLVPGPNSTELAIHLGWVRAGWPGLVLAGACFIAPSALLVLAMAAAYVHYGTTPALAGVLYGIKPVLIAIVVSALLGLGRAAVKGPLLGVLGLVVLAAYVAGVNELALLAGAGILSAARTVRPTGRLPGALAPLALVAWRGTREGELATLLVVFLRVGAVLYGSGYVLLALLRGELVDRLGWLSEAQLLDAVAVGQLTPGPVLTTATFIGYLLAGAPGALVATVGIFAPSFLFVALLTRLAPRLRASTVLGAALDGVNVASVALMAGVTLTLAGDALVDPLTVGLAVASGALVWRVRPNPTWLVAGGALVGLARSLLG